MTSFDRFRRRFAAATPDDATDPQRWRADVLSTMLRVVFAGGVVTAVPSVLLSLAQDLLAVAILDVAAVTWVAVVALRPSLPYAVRAGSLLLLAYVLGVVFLVTIGITSLIYLMAVPSLTALFLGLRPGIGALVVTTVTLVSVGYATDAEIRLAALEAVPLLKWSVIGLNFGFVSGMIAVATAVILNQLLRSFDRQRAITASLEAGQAELQETNAELAREVRSRREAEEETRRLARAIEQAREAVLISDVDGRVIYANSSWERAAGGAGDSMVGQLLQSLQTADGDPEIAAVIAEGRDWTGTVVTDGPDGRQRQFETIVSPIREPDGTVLNLVAVLRDVTLERQMESRLRQSERLQAIGTLAGGVAHDFNNIVGSILAVAEGTRDTDDMTSIREGVEHIVVACQRARDVVRQMMDFSRQRNNERRPTSMRAVLDEAVPLLRAAIPSSIRILRTGDVDGHVVADPSELHQVVMNLASNASHAMRPAGGGDLTLGVSSMTADADVAATHPGMVEGQDYMVLTVSDTGHGIPAAILDRIFDPFFTTKEARLGTGLGLASVHGIVTSLGGAIDVYSEEGLGTSFRILLPTTDEVRVSEGGPTAARLSGDSLLTGSGRILLVDDEPAILMMAERLLRRLGYDVVAAADGPAALRLFDDEPDDFDLVISDLTMPGMSGAQLIRAIHDGRPGLPAILTSGFSDSMSDEERAALDLASFLQKPFTQLEIARQVRAALDR